MLSVTTKIQCAICNKPVDKIEFFEKPDTLSRCFRAHCHGQIDECELPMDMLVEGINIRQGLSNGVAFTNKKLPNKAKELTDER